MMWLFAILLVLLMGGVAVVAAGRGTPMAPEYGDRPDVLVGEGPLRAEDLRRVRFSTAVRGYRMDEVDTLLRRLAEQLEHAEGERPDEQPVESPHERPGPAAKPGAVADDDH